MEHAQGDVLCVRSMLLVSCLNPYFNGTCSKRPSTKTRLHMILTRSLNPYFNGTCSKSQLIHKTIDEETHVLILILMEHAQRECRPCSGSASYCVVLILILMEHAQRALSDRVSATTVKRLNPYFNGTCSKR